MTVDRVQRKAAKKGWKRQATQQQKKLDAAGIKRVRKKANAKRRLCQGMCYKEPGSDITEADRKWSPNSSDDEGAHGYDSDKDEKITELETVSKFEAKSKPEKKKEKKSKLSTGVQLMDPSKASGDKPVHAKPKKLSEVGEGAPDLQPFHPMIQSCMAHLGFNEPTPIQEQAWPACCQGRDMKGVAEPGSGKTLAYILPAAVKLQDQNLVGPSSKPPEKGPLVLILAPTRELAMQVAQQSRHLRPVTGMRTACVFGGVPKEAQIDLLQKHPHVLVATPGRLLDLLDDGVLTLNQVCCVVLDEADKMLSLGFHVQLERLRQLLLSKATPEKGSAAVQGRPQVLLFTATMPPEVGSAAATWLVRPLEVSISHSAASISRTITQVVQVCAEHKKPAKLLKHLAAVKQAGTAMRNPPRVLVFANKIKTVRFLNDAIAAEGYRVVMLHGQRSQAERDEAMTAFRSGKCQVMVATDVAARGLDIRALPYVVNYDFPTCLETYIHRVGRTGRLAANGHAFSFFTRNLAKLAGPLVDLLSQHDQALDPNLDQLAQAWREAAVKAGGEAKLEAQLRGVSGGSRQHEDDESSHHDQLETLMEQRMEASDLMEGLRAAGALRQLTGDKKKSKKLKRAKEDDPEIGDNEPDSGRDKVKGAAAKKIKRNIEEAEPPPSLQNRLKKAKAAGVEEAVHKSSVDNGGLVFMPMTKFSGSRKGYVFKKGSLGLGYYKDTPPIVVRKTSVALQQRGKGPIVPVGPQGKGGWSDDDESDDEPLQQKQKNVGKNVQQGKGRQQNKKKPIPGRLRKKLKADAVKK